MYIYICTCEITTYFGLKDLERTALTLEPQRKYDKGFSVMTLWRTGKVTHIHQKRGHVTLVKLSSVRVYRLSPPVP